MYRFKFNCRFRKQGETVQQYVAELRSLSVHCDFHDQLEEMMRDRFVCGVNDERIQRRLLAESRLDFKKALELATAMEIADKNTRDKQQGNSVEKPKCNVYVTWGMSREACLFCREYSELLNVCSTVVWPSLGVVITSGCTC